MFIKCLQYSSVMGDSRKTQNLVSDLRELLAVLGRNQLDISADITGVHTSHELPLRYCRSPGKDSINGKKPINWASLASVPSVS